MPNVGTKDRIYRPKLRPPDFVQHHDPCHYLRRKPGIRANDILSTLEKSLECEVLLIPHDHYCDFESALRKKLVKALSPRFNVVELHFDTDRYLATSWSYINYLQVGKTVIAPAVNPRLDELAQRQLEEYLQLPIDNVPALGIVRLGGGLNCASWTRRDEHYRAKIQIQCTGEAVNSLNRKEIAI